MSARRGRAARLLLLLWCVAVAAFWVVSALASGGIRGGSLAVDYRSFLGATRAFFAFGPAAGYDLAAASAALQHAFGPGAAVPPAAPAPYPPVFFLLLAPFSALSPLLGFALWTLLNLALAVLALGSLISPPAPLSRKRARGFRLEIGSRTSPSGWRDCSAWMMFGRLLPVRGPSPAARERGPEGEVRAGGSHIMLGLLFFPLTLSLYAGQPSGVLLYGLHRSYRALKAGDDWRAGLWLGVLLLKPQYALGLLLVLLLHRRWRALGGAALIGAILAGTSLVLAGWGGLLAYKAMLSSVAGFRSAPDGIVPAIMLSWRGLLVNLLPTVSDAAGERLTLLLSAATLALLPLLWRGRWDPRAARFDERFLATVAATLLASYHSHIYGATLLLVPGAALLARRRGGAPLQALLWLELLAPAPLFVLGRSLTPVAIFYACCLAATLAVVLGQEMALRRMPLIYRGSRLGRRQAPPSPPIPGGERQWGRPGAIVSRSQPESAPAWPVAVAAPPASGPPALGVRGPSSIPAGRSAPPTDAPVSPADGLVLPAVGGPPTLG